MSGRHDSWHALPRGAPYPCGTRLPLRRHLPKPPRVEWHGAWAWLLILVFVGEAVLTVAIEKRVRARLGEFPAERVTHNAMAIVYGLIIANLFPVRRLGGYYSWALRQPPRQYGSG